MKTIESELHATGKQEFFNTILTLADNSAIFSSAIGGVIGALAGGVPAWLLARRSSAEQIAAKQKERSERELVTAFRIFSKLGKMTNDLVSTYVMVKAMMERPTQEGDESPIQRKVSAFANLGSVEDAVFSSDDLYILVAANEADYLTELDLLSRRYVSLFQGLSVYSLEKRKLHERLLQVEDLKFGLGDVILTPIEGQHADALRAGARVLESLIVPLVEQLEEDASKSLQLAEEFGPKMKIYFGPRRVPAFDFSAASSKFPELLKKADVN